MASIVEKMRKNTEVTEAVLRLINGMCFEEKWAKSKTEKEVCVIDNDMR